MLNSKLKRIFGALQKNVAVILLVAAALVVVSVGYIAVYTTPKYTSTSKIIIHDGNLISPSAQYEGGSNKAFLEACTEILNSSDIFNYYASANSLNKNYGSEALAEMIRVEPKGGDSLVFFVYATADDPDEAVRISSDFSGLMANYLRNAVQHLSIYTLESGGEPVSNRGGSVLIVLAALAVGILASSVIVIVFDLTNGKLSGQDDFKSRYSADILGVVPDFSENRQEKRHG